MFEFRFIPSAIVLASGMLSISASTEARPPDALDATIMSPSAPYRSAFTDYQSFQDTASVPWKIANDTVGQSDGIAGHDMSKMKGMEGMKDMEGMKGMEGKKGMEGNKIMEGSKGTEGTANREKDAPGKRTPMPATKHDMTQMKGVEEMPAHKMESASEKSKTAPASGKNMKDMKGMKGMEGMSNHDMQNMPEKSSVVPSKP